MDIQTNAPAIGPDERLDDLQLCGMKIIQKRKGFRFGMDAVLLADFAAIRPGDVFGDFGTGGGILPLLLFGRGKGSRCHAFEIQPEYAALAERNAKLNHLEDRLHVYAMNCIEAERVLPACSLHAIVCNPPYGAPGTSMHGDAPEHAVARHQEDEGLLPWFRSAHRLLKGRGRLAVIYPAPRMLEVMKLMEEAHLTPKRVRLIYPSARKPANLVLIEAVRDAKPLLQPEPPLVIYREDGEMTDELKDIYHLEYRAGEGVTEDA